MFFKIKNFILLTVVLFLVFTLVGECSWLIGWDQRVKFTIDHTKVDAALTWFPVTVFLTSTQGEEVFAEFDADADYLKVAFTKADGITQLYAECELFDDSESKGVYHVSRDGWAISDSADTEFYMYYDNDHADNTTYIGAINTVAGGNVWNNFEAVYHKVDETTSTIKDSTSNNQDGTKKAANEPVETTGKVGKAQRYDGGDDYITLPNYSNWTGITQDYTLSCIVYLDDFGDIYHVIFLANSLSGVANRNTGCNLIVNTDGSVTMRVGQGVDGVTKALTTASGLISTTTWHHITVVKDGTSYFKIFIDGEEAATTSTGISANNILWNAELYAQGVCNIGDEYYDGARYHLMDGIIDEVQISNIPRLAFWIKASYHSLFDTLLAYGSQEIPPAIGEFKQWIRLTIDYTKVDAALTWFPVTVFLTSTVGDCVFDELGSDANRFKIAFTKEDRVTQLYAEIEKWDDANESAVIHVSRDGWVISNAVDTIFYLFFDADVNDNTNVYIGDTDSVAAENVWDNSFERVYHFGDNTLDSTSNDRDATAATYEDGIVGRAHDGNNPTAVLFSSIVNLTVEIIIKDDANNAGANYLINGAGGTDGYVVPYVDPDNNIDIVVSGKQYLDGDIKANGTPQYVVARRNATTWDLKVNNVVSNIDNTTTSPDAPSTNIQLLAHIYYSDEIRLSTIRRADAWIKGTYNSLWNTLLSYSGKLTSGDVIWFGVNF